MAEYRIGEVADMLGMSIAIVRAWTLELAGFLSTRARWQATIEGQRALPVYDDHDIVLLCRVQRLREQGLSFEGVRAWLAEQQSDAASEPAALASAQAADAAGGQAKNAYELALAALYDALRVQGGLIQRLQDEAQTLRNAHDQLAKAHVVQRQRYLAIIRRLLRRELTPPRQREVGA